jgi:ribosomal protein S18 acetylase RimI-like enzyme
MDIKRITINDKIDIKVVDRLFKKFLISESKYDENYKIREDLKSFEQDLNNENNIILTCKKDNDVVAFLYGYINQTKNELLPVAHLAFIYVEEEFRCKKIASNLINEFLNELKNRKIEFVEVNAFFNNGPAIRLYEKYGFCANYINYRKKI